MVGKEKKNVKNVTKSSNKDKVVVNLHGLKMKCVIIEGWPMIRSKLLSPLNNLRRLRKINSRKSVTCSSQHV